MLTALLLFAVFGALSFWQQGGTPWLQAVPAAVFPALAVLAALYLLWKLARWLRIVIAEHLD